MRQSLIKKYHQDSSSSSSFETSLNPAATPSWNKDHLQQVAGLLLSGRLSPGPVIEIVQSQLGLLRNNEALLSRASTHLIIILLAALAIGLSNTPFAWDGLKAIRPLKPVPVDAVLPAAVTETEIPLRLPAQLNNIADDVLVQAAVPRTIIPKRTQAEISTYEVQNGDTTYGIAAHFGLAPETIVWSNPSLENNPDLLTVGEKLTILPVDGVYHQVGEGDTIAGIAATFRADPAAIINYPLNELDPDNPVIKSGQWLIVPGGSKPFVPRTVTAYNGPIPDDALTGTGIFAWPASGTIFQGYWSAHPAIDIAAWLGAPITAADSGHVIAAGWDNLYGYYVVIDHGNGFQTLYAHLQAYYVEVGDNVAKGQQIGEMGSTGNSTGPHLHFEVRQGTVQRNPIGFLP